LLARAIAASYGAAFPFPAESVRVPPIRPVLALALLALAGCAGRRGDFDETGGVYQVRSACPRVGVAAGTGDVTLFDPAGARTADAIDIVAVMTDVRGACSDATDPITSQVTFRVDARRRDTAAARDVTLPYFLTVVQGGNAVVAKRVARVTLHFNAGQARASATGSATASVNRSAAVLSADVRRRLTERRKAGREDAAIDPLTRPEVRQAVLRASFEALVGFQLTDEQLRYNATR
jgi:hypothetical protein